MRGSLINSTQILGALHDGKLSKADANQRLSRLTASVQADWSEWPVNGADITVDVPGYCWSCLGTFWMDTLILVAVGGKDEVMCSRCLAESGIPLTCVVGDAFSDRTDDYEAA